MKPLPANHQAERELLCAWLLNKSAAREVGSLCAGERITPAHFDDPRHQVIFAELMAMWHEGASCDLFVLNSRLIEKGLLESAGGFNYLNIDLSTATPTAARITDYSEALRKAHGRRRLAVESLRSYEAAMSGEGDASQILYTAQRNVADITIAVPAKQKTGLRDYMIEYINSLESLGEGADAIGLGMPHLETAAGPFVRGNVIVVCGQAKSGKTTLAVNMAENAALKGRRVLMFSLEMAGSEIAERIIASQGQMDMRAIKRKMINKIGLYEGEHKRLTNAAEKMLGVDMQLICDANSLGQIIAESRAQHAAKPVDVLVLDYIQLVEGIREKGDSREREVASISRGMKLLATELNCLVIMLSQLNDEGKLRESRAIGQDANLVLAVKETENGGRILRVVAGRSAPGGTEIPLRWQPEFNRFETADSEE